MVNTETDKLGLIQIINFEEILSNFSRSISVTDRFFCIVVFRGERHVGSIHSKDIAHPSDIQKSCERIGVRTDDTLLKVNLGSKLITISGTFTTLDYYQHSFKVALELKVTNTSQFALRYRQQDDPVGIALAALEGEFRRYAARYLYDQLRTDVLGYSALNILNVGSNKDIGLDVASIHDVMIQMDPLILQSRENEERRKQEFLDQVAKAMAGKISDRIREKGPTLDEIFFEHPELQDIYPVPLIPETSESLRLQLLDEKHHSPEEDYKITAQKGVDLQSFALKADQNQPFSPRPLRVFLCHSSGDKHTVHQLYQRLQACNVDPWLDEEKLLPGQNWEQEIRKAVRASDIVIVCLSPGSVNKVGFVQKEIKFALDVANEQPEDTIFLIPLKLEECEVPERLRHLQWVDYRKEDGIYKLLSALKSRSESFGEMLASVTLPNS